jgi:hypothetical protein
MMTPDCADEFTAALYVMRCSKKNKVQKRRRETVNSKVGSYMYRRGRCFLILQL